MFSLVALLIILVHSVHGVIQPPTHVGYELHLAFLDGTIPYSGTRNALFVMQALQNPNSPLSLWLLANSYAIDGQPQSLPPRIRFVNSTAVFSGNPTTTTTTITTTTEEPTSTSTTDSTTTTTTTTTPTTTTTTTPTTTTTTPTTTTTTTTSTSQPTTTVSSTTTTTSSATTTTTTTPPPTSYPTPPPTSYPTPPPTSYPTPPPTSYPTPPPTTYPTPPPTTYPTPPPTTYPTPPPTTYPTPPPTTYPTPPPTSYPTPPPTLFPTPPPTSATQCPLIGRCTASSGDAFSICAAAGACPAGTVPDPDIMVGESCLGASDPLQQTCQCCKRVETWKYSACYNDTVGYKTCVAQGTCVSHFGGEVNSKSCGTSAMECCDFDTWYTIEGDVPPEVLAEQCNGGYSNDVVEGDEVCDGTALNGASCVTLGFAGGTLRCDASCTHYDASQCVPYGACCTSSSTCMESQTLSSCNAMGGQFTALASCTANLCYARQYSSVPQYGKQLATANFELGTSTLGKRSFAKGSGSSCNAGCFFGTAGIMLESTSNTSRYVLSNSHVWATPVGYAQDSNCAQSVPPQRGDFVVNSLPCAVSTGNFLGTLAAFTHLTPGSQLKIDAALAEVNDAVTYKPVPVQLGLGDQVQGPPATVQLGDYVVKAGSKTGITLGQVIGIDTTVVVAVPSDDSSNSSYGVVFTHQLLIEGVAPTHMFTDHGDSGSGIFTTDMRGVALLFAGNSAGLCIANDLDHVLAAFFPDGGRVAGVPQSTTKRAPVMRPLESMVPHNRIVAPLSGKVEQARLAKAEQFGQSQVVRELMQNRTFVAQYVSVGRRSGEPQIVTAVSSLEAYYETKRKMPESVNGVRNVVVIQPPFFAN